MQTNLEANRSRMSGVRKREMKAFGRALLFLAPSIVLFATFVFIPLVRTFVLSSYLTDPIGRAVRFIGLGQYERMFSNDVFFNSLTRSALFVLYTVPPVIILALVLAVLANIRLRGISIFRIIFSITIAISGATASLMFMYMYHPSIGSINYFLSLVGLPQIPWLIERNSALAAVAITSIWLQLGLNTVILLAAMQGISEELYESAMIDGAGGWQRFINITLPMLSSTFFFLAIVDMLASFQTFTPIHIMTAGGPLDATNLLVYSIYREFYFNARYGMAAAQSIMLFLVMLALTVFQFTVVEKRVYYE